MAMPVMLAGIAIVASTASARDTEDSAPSVTYPAGTAWTLSYPLGSHIESTLDTTLYNYQRGFTTALGSDAWATTGQFSAPGINMLYFDRVPSTPFFFENALSYWVPTFSKQKFYNVYIPYTQLSYNMGYGTECRTDHLKAEFAGNANKRVGIGAWIDYPYTKGAYNNQATKGLGFGFSGYYNGDRYDLQAFVNHYSHLNKENGGITDDLYILDPARLQGGVNEIEPKSIPVNLNAAHNRLTGTQFYMNHAYKTGFWKDTTQPEDTVEKREFIPVMKFVYSLDLKDNHRFFINTNPAEGNEFWEHTYFNTSGTREDAFYTSVGNTLGLEMIEGFSKWTKFGLSAYAAYEFAKYRYAVEGLEKNNDLALGRCFNRLWVGGRLQKTKGTALRYSADARFGLSGDTSGDIDITGKLESRFRLGKDTVSISACGSFSNLEPDYTLRHFVGNHFIWDNDFGKTRTVKAGARLYIPWSKTELRFDMANIQNQVYFGPDCTPVQHSGNVQVLAASIFQKLRFGIWNWDNTVTWQHSSDTGVNPLPKLAVYSNMYLYFHAFKALTVQVGIDCNWYSKYLGYAYQPATMSFHTQGADGTKCGDFIFSDAYLTCKLYKVRFFVMCSNLNQGWWSKDYFSLPHYPLDPRQLRLGLSIDFAN